MCFSSKYPTHNLLYHAKNELFLTCIFYSNEMRFPTPFPEEGGVVTACTLDILPKQRICLILVIMSIAVTTHVILQFLNIKKVI